jgi:Lrp/AsnC family leucine-responsive transcriptional regulator
MREPDETDLEILELLMSDARRPWNDIAEIVDLSPPAVSDRVAYLQEMGVIQRFTLDIDRSQLREGVPVLLTLEVSADEFEAVRKALREADAVEYVFRTAENDLLCYARVGGGDVPMWLSETLDGGVDDYEVTLLTDVEWTPSIGGTEFALTCAECGNSVTSEGVVTRIGDDLYQFCCPSCEASFETQYKQFEKRAMS